MAPSPKWWYEYHREDYQSVKERLRMCRNVMLHGPIEAAADMLRKSTVNAVLSIQTQRDRHESAFTAYYSGDVRLEKAAGMTVYGNQKARWLHESLATFDFQGAVRVLRSPVKGDAPNAQAALGDLEDTFKGLGWTKAAFSLAMCGIWELACPDTRTKQQIGYDGRINSRDDFSQALNMIDDILDIDEPLFIKQWVLYDYQEGEHARHMPFFREAIHGL
jgi:hypothetical protein